MVTPDGDSTMFVQYLSRDNVISTVYGLDFTLSPYPFFGLTLVTNVLVTALTAGRIWGICRRYLKISEQRGYTSCVTILDLIAESAAEWCFTTKQWLAGIREDITPFRILFWCLSLALRNVHCPYTALSGRAREVSGTAGPGRWDCGVL
ncbi:hypothetical protein C8R45DRAFT_944380 [Mycena sanguinolenta]|nr:hypothetical protein C8R45DRAFT_944380 [Mycena sanguinolenta]